VVDIEAFDKINKEMQEYDEMRETIIKESRGLRTCPHACVSYGTITKATKLHAFILMVCKSLETGPHRFSLLSKLQTLRSCQSRPFIACTEGTFKGLKQS
jgi:hypothetical protein